MRTQWQRFMLLPFNVAGARTNLKSSCWSAMSLPIVPVWGPAEILSIAVHTSERKHGLGRRLLDINMRRLAGLGVRSLFLEVAQDNLAARKLYQRAGFRDVGRREAYYADRDGAAALILRRELT